MDLITSQSTTGPLSDPLLTSTTIVFKEVSESSVLDSGEYYPSLKDFPSLSKDCVLVLLYYVNQYVYRTLFLLQTIY